MRILKGIVPALLVTATTALAAEAPPVPDETANNANDLQVAAWACEGGAAFFDQVAKPGGRFFLGSVDASADRRNELPLVLEGGGLAGLGSLSTNSGWSNIRFDCGLTPDLRQATSFKFEVLSPIPGGNSTSANPNVATSPYADRMGWYTSGAGHLIHGIEETDSRDFIASCVEGSGIIRIPLTSTVPWLKGDSYATVSISAGQGSGLYVAQAVMDDELGAFAPVLTIATEDPLIGWIARGSSLLVSIGSETVYEVSLKGSAQAAKAFAAECRK